eukprot:13245846-Alexandrium_andersonii.AAC.1
MSATGCSNSSAAEEVAAAKASRIAGCPRPLVLVANSCAPGTLRSPVCVRVRGLGPRAFRDRAVRSCALNANVRR